MEFRAALEDESGEKRLALLTVKRPEFRHEAEVRVIYRELEKAATDSGSARTIPCLPASVIEEVVVDPRSDSSTLMLLSPLLRIDCLTWTSVSPNYIEFQRGMYPYTHARLRYDFIETRAIAQPSTLSSVPTRSSPSGYQSLTEDAGSAL